MSDKKPINGFCIQKKFIKDALIELMRTKTIDRISILELCKTADVNRNTFYAHYSTPEDVLNEIENELVEEFRKFMNISEDRRSADECTDPIYFLKKNKDVHGVLIRSRSSRKGRNFQTGTSVQIPSSKSVGFRAGKNLKEAVNK